MTPEVSAVLAGTPDPARAAAALERIRSAWPESQAPLAAVLETFGPALPALLHLLAISPISATKITRDPDALLWLAAPAIRDSGRGTLRMRAALRDVGWQRPAESGAPVKPETFSLLRKWKQRETLRIALRDVAGLADVEETTRQLSDLAEICMREVSDAWLADHTRRLGDPGTPHVVLGMGKFGAAELNFSSDIDVIFFYGEPGELASGLTRQEFYSRFVQRIIETFAASDPAGPLFRIDVRLRPEGDGGPLVRSLDSMENYYAAFGETWERMALSKARVVAGDEELGYEFFQRLQSFIYPRVVGHDMIDEIAQIKGRIERELVGAARIHRDVKLGRGGIREIEFVCQALQLLHGARHAFLQERQTLRALAALRQLGMIGAADADVLASAYRFLRTVEHHLQIENEAQTHTIPENSEALRRLARSLSALRESSAADPLECFLITLIRHMDGARSIFERVTQSRVDPVAPPADLRFFRDPAGAQKNLEDFGGGNGRARIAPRTRKLFARLEPFILEHLREVADPDAALTRLARFTERYGLRGALFETLLVNPRVLELLVKLFDASPFLSEIAIQRPQLVEEVARLGNLGAPISCGEHMAGLARNDERLPWEAWVRVYRRAQQLRIGLRDLLGFASLTEVWSECSALAEACLVFTANRLGFSDCLTTIALGKFGGRELGYGADLDVLFIGRDASAAADLTRAMTATTADGRVFPIDARLRPEGESGQMAITLEAWTDYFKRGRGELWEVQALTKARPVDGPEQASWLGVAQKIWRERGRATDLRKRIQCMLQRIAEHRGGDPMLDFKTGPGGLMQLEFYVQALQMAAGAWEPNTLAALAKVAPGNAMQPLIEACLFLRHIENILRRAQDAPISRIPADPEEQTRLAKRCGFPNAAAFLEANQRTRETIARLARL
jgi:glutamate-ammonia-ligase adenylyltransferase